MRSIPKISAERMDFSVRLKQTLESAHGLPPSPTIIAREFNFRFVGKPVTVHAARKWLVGEAIPTQDKLRSLAAWLDVSVDWLRFGGQRANVDHLPLFKSAAQPSPQDNLVRLFLTLPHRDRLLAQDFIEMLGKKNRKRAVDQTLVQETLSHS